MFDWNRNGKIDLVDHWITCQIINAEKEKRKNSTSYPAVRHNVSPENKNKNNNNNAEQKEISLPLLIMIDIVLFALLCAIK